MSAGKQLNMATSGKPYTQILLHVAVIAVLCWCMRKASQRMRICADMLAQQGALQNCCPEIIRASAMARKMLAKSVQSMMLEIAVQRSQMTMI